MRRKSERTAATKKAKASPEKKVEKVKRTRSKRKKQSSSSENESADDASPTRVEVPVETEEAKPPKTPVKEESPEEAQDQVWKVKAAEGNVGEIQKLKICLTRPPSTPERAERSPRSKRKHSRATSSSDTTSVEATDEKEKRKSRRPKRAHRESKDEADKNLDSQEDEMETETASQDNTEVSTRKQILKDETSENTITTSNQSHESVQSSEDTSTDQVVVVEVKDDKVSDADTTVVSPKVSDTPAATIESVPPEPESTQADTQESKTESKEDQKDTQNKSQESQKDNNETQNEKDGKNKRTNEKEQVEEKKEQTGPERRRSMSVDKSEILELHESDNEMEKSKADDTETATAASQEDKVSKVTEEKASNKELKKDYRKDTNLTGVVESSYKEKRERNESTDSLNHRDARKSIDDSKLQHSDSIQSNQEEPTQNGQAAPIVVSRKRRWGSRPAKITTQKSITISTDVLKDIIPDVKPVEFDEVIEERKPKREVSEKVERPILPKIIIDNTENIDRNIEHKREKDDKERDMVKPRESHLAANRKISIVKDNDSIIARPPSPPRHKQSCVLYITNLVRPFTLPQLKNLLQRTGRIVENGFWIDKIKSRCFVIYETEDQAVETRHALHGVTWPVSNPKTLQVDFSTQEAFDKTKTAEETDGPPVSTIPGTVEDWLREQDQKRERGELEKPWERRSTREWDLGKNENDKEKEKRFENKDQRPLEKRRHRSPERTAEPARKFKKKEEEAPAKLLDDLFKKTKTTPCIYWLPLSAETIAIKEEQRRQHMAEHERRLNEAQQRRALRDRERDRRH